jgi:hypothetical protein
MYDCVFFVPVDGMYKSDPNLECFAWRERFDSPKGKIRKFCLWTSPKVVRSKHLLQRGVVGCTTFGQQLVTWSTPSKARVV